MNLQEKRLQHSNSLKKQYVRKEVYSIESVLTHVELVTTKEDIVLFDGDKMKMGSDRYKTFKFKGLTCIGTCGRVGSFFAKEKFKKQSDIESYHFNLYAVDKDGTEVMMTKDHILPKSKGGKNIIDNYQPMCTICNCEKGNTI